MFANRVLRKIFERTSSPNTLRAFRSIGVGWTGMWQSWGRRTCRLFVRKTDLKRPFGWLRRSWVDNIKTDHKGIGREVVDCFDLAEDREKGRSVAYIVVNLRVAWSVGCFLTGWSTVGFPVRARVPGVSSEKCRCLLCVLQAKCLIPALYAVPRNCVLCLVVSEVWKLRELIILFILCWSAVVYLIWFRCNCNRTKTNASEIQIFAYCY